LLENYNQKEADFKAHIKRIRNYKNNDPLEIPVPKHTACNICNLHYQDFKIHIASIEHKTMTNRWKERFDQIDELIDLMN